MSTCLRWSLIASMILVLSMCGGKAENIKTDGTDSLEELLRTPGYEKRSAIIFDFQNMTNNSELDFLEQQVAERIFQKVNRVFYMPDTSVVRRYVKKENYTDEQLRDWDTLKYIAEEFQADVFIYGTIAGLGEEVQIIGKIAAREGGKLNDFTLTTKKENLLSALDDLSEDVYRRSLKSFPPQRATEERIIEESSGKIALIEVVEHFIEKTEVSQKSDPAPDPRSTNEYPSPRPAWTYELPSEEGYYFYMGQSMGEHDYAASLRLAVQDAFLAMSYSVGVNVESTYQEATFTGKHEHYTEVTSNLVVETLNYIRGDQMVERYYRRLDDGTFEVCVLFKLPRLKLEESMEESVQAESTRLQMEYEHAVAERELAEAARIQAEIEKLESQLRLLQALKEQEQRTTTPPRTYKPYTEPDPSIQVASTDPDAWLDPARKESAQAGVTTTRPVVEEPEIEYLHPKRRAGVIFIISGIVGGGLGGLCTFGAYRYDEQASQLYTEYQSYLPIDGSKTEAEMDTLYNDAESKREWGNRFRTSSYAWYGLGGIFFITGIGLAAYKVEKDPSDSVSVGLYPVLGGGGLRLSVRF